MRSAITRQVPHGSYSRRDYRSDGRAPIRRGSASWRSLAGLALPCLAFYAVSRRLHATHALDQHAQVTLTSRVHIHTWFHRETPCGCRARCKLYFISLSPLRRRLFHFRRPSVILGTRMWDPLMFNRFAVLQRLESCSRESPSARSASTGYESGIRGTMLGSKEIN